MNFYVDGNNAGTVPSVRQVSFHSGLSLAQTRNFSGTRTYQGIASVEFYLPTLSRPGVNFTNIFTHSFLACSSQKHKNSVELSVSFTLLGSTRAKVGLKMLMKLTPEVFIAMTKSKTNPINTACNAK